MKITLDITRFDPETDAEVRQELYHVEAEPADRVLDTLMHIVRYQDGTLAFRKSCAHGVCGSDAMRINGKERLACKTLIRDVAHEDGDVISLAPLRHFPVQKDLMVDQTEFLAKFRDVKPFFLPKDAPPPRGEFFQSVEDRELIDDATKCINCGACYSACPKLDENPDFLGPAALV
ncbi:MAG: succinate dehydrogenase iron-sulfur subunit, partial [spirochete symbiont of Stewartia floridana]